MRLLEAWQPRRRIDEFHVHHTWRPRHADFRGLATIEAMRRYHVQHAGMSDIAQHLSIDPVGGLWTGRSFDQAPASARGRNGDARRGPFMIEMIGDFDVGQDELKGAQKDAVQAVIVAVLRKFGLDERAVRFHNEFAPKTCPGTSLDLAVFRQEIAALLAGSRGISLPLVAEDAPDDAADDERAMAAPNDAADEPAYAEVPEEPWMLAQQAFLADAITPGDARAPVPPGDALMRHVVNLSKGVLSREGDIATSENTLDMIVGKHLPDYIATHKHPHILLYAHGGLVPEKGALCYARTILPWWLAHGVYPIFFVWESGLIDTLRERPRAFTDPLVEWTTQWAARRIWRDMKRDGENVSSPWLPEHQQPGGGWLFVQKLRRLLDAHPNVKLHAAGHSTGPIVLSTLLPLLTDTGHTIDTLSYLAPAIRTDVFRERVLPLLTPGAARRVRDLTVYTMTDAAERADSVALLYRKSLLYYVRQACEDADNGRVLGLEKDLRADAQLSQRFGLAAGGVSFGRDGCSVEFSPPRSGQAVGNPKTRALGHSAFDNDAATMFSVLARVLGHAPVVDRPAAQFPSEAMFSRCGLAIDTADDAQASRAATQDACPCCNGSGRRPAAVKAPDPFLDGEDDEDDAPEDETDSGNAHVDAPARVEPHNRPPEAPAVITHRRTGRRFAFCAGIDEYASMPLSGCVNDSRQWAESLKSLGFKVTAIANAQATLDGLRRGLTSLIESARAGDELVFQFAGHGTRVRDASGDETTTRQDCAYVPFDYEKGGVFLDDEIYDLSLRVPDGATLTFFPDCCHSGTSSRFAKLSPLRLPANEKVRYLPLPAAQKRKFAPKLARGARAAAHAAPPGVIQFAACADSQYAYETEGQGDFTRHAAPLLVRAAREGLTNKAFIGEIVRLFGRKPRQTPSLLSPYAGLASRALLGGAT